MKTFMNFITNYYWILLLVSLFLIISIVGIKAEDRKKSIETSKKDSGNKK